MRERLHIPAEVHAWQEDESPTKLAAQALADRGIRSGRSASKKPPALPSSIISATPRRDSNSPRPTP